MIYARLDLDPVRQSVERATSAMFEAANLKPTAHVKPLTCAADIDKPKRGAGAA